MSSGQHTPPPRDYGLESDCEARQFGLNIDAAAVDDAPKPSALCKVPPRLIITCTTVVVVSGLLLCLRPRFVMSYDKQQRRYRVCCHKLLLWVALVGLVVHCNQQMIYLYGLLLQPIKAACFKSA